MKRLLTILSLLICSLWVLAQTKTYETGVSLSLAQHRAATIHNLHYDLYFNIPEKKGMPVEGEETVSFTMDEKQEVALDFRATQEMIHSVSTAKGKKVEYRFEAEHVIIPEKYTRKGKNAFRIAFTAGDQSLNRNDEYMYTLFVPDRARTCFPCFDQPDMKAVFTLSLKAPREWKAVSNSPLCKNDKGIMTFAPSEMLPTYLFAFAAGKFNYQEYEEDGRKIGAYYRESEKQKVQQLPEIFRQVMYSLRWQEDFTAHPYGFAKYDLVILPGFQFGGMEHTGCTFYNDNTIFLSQNPTPDEILSRANLIAHETSHMWFGDLVTMRWFNDVWTKEVFANYFAAEIIAPQFPDYNFDLYWLQKFKTAAIEQDRTEGRTAIQQPLDNMRNAGLIYNNIIYNKAPLVMREIVRLMGKEAFQRGIRRYIHDYAYGNATWDDLIAILNEETPVTLDKLSELWVKQPFYPTISSTSARPNPDGRAYAFFTLSAEQASELMQNWSTETDAVARQSFLMTLYENYRMGNISPSQWAQFILQNLPTEKDPLTLSTLVSYMKHPLWRLADEEREEVEQQLFVLARGHEQSACRLQLLRLLITDGNSKNINGEMYVIWKETDSDLLSERDYMTMAYELSVRYPGLAHDILAEERGRLLNPDRIRQFDYISRAVSADEEARDSLFRWLLVPENRRIEPWAGSALYYLNHHLRDVESVKYISEALEALEEVQRTGDIFFPGRWCSSLLSGHRSEQSRKAVEEFLNAHPHYPQLLKNKILESKPVF